MSDLPKEWEELADSLLGSSRTLEQGLQDHGLDEGLINDERFCEFLDGRILCCVSCGWWDEPHEIDDDGNCEDCHGEEDEEAEEG